MSDEEIQALKAAVKKHPHQVIWLSPHGYEAIVVKSVQPPPKEEDPEPSECAFFHTGNYVALYNCSLRDFAIAVAIEA